MYMRAFWKTILLFKAAAMIGLNCFQTENRNVLLKKNYYQDFINIKYQALKMSFVTVS